MSRSEAIIEEVVRNIATMSVGEAQEFIVMMGRRLTLISDAIQVETNYARHAAEDTLQRRVVGEIRTWRERVSVNPEPAPSTVGTCGLRRDCTRTWNGILRGGRARQRRTQPRLSAQESR